MQLNRTAPIVARHEIAVAAPVEAVWEAHTRIDKWPRWQADITRAGRQRAVQFRIAINL